MYQVKLTTKNIAKHNKRLNLNSYPPAVRKAIQSAWDFKVDGTVTIDVYTNRSSRQHGDVLAIDILKPHGSYYGGKEKEETGYAYVYYSNDTQHYLQHKKIYANTKGLYIELDGRTYLDLPDIDIEDRLFLA